MIEVDFQKDEIDKNELDGERLDTIKPVAVIIVVQMGDV